VTDERAALAEVELLGALTYGQLRAYTAAVAVVPLAPDVRRADELLAFSLREQLRYQDLRARLAELTDLTGPVLDRQKGPFDAFFDTLPLTDWLGGVTFLAVGLPMAADFARAVAPVVGDRTAKVIVATIAGRARMEAFALHELRGLLEGDATTAERARGMVADVVGLALTSFTSSLAQTDALRVLFERRAADLSITGEGVVKRMAIEVLGAHRRRMVDLDLDEL
jgi:hypothetical protein